MSWDAAEDYLGSQVASFIVDVSFCLMGSIAEFL